MKLQRVGGYAAIASVCVLAAYAALALSLDKRFGGAMADPSKVIATVSNAPVDFYALPVLSIVHFILWQTMFFALYECLQNNAPRLTRIAVIAASAGTAIVIAARIVEFEIVRVTLLPGMVPMKDIAAYWAINGIREGLLFTGGHFYGWAFLLTGWAILRASTFSAVSGWLFIVSALPGIPAFMVPQVALPAHIIACVAAIWIGVALLRQKQSRSTFEQTGVSNG